jgi:predicted glycoside hydrolase/deacetylase ChbG (UPF0249 family)
LQNRERTVKRLIVNADDFGRTAGVNEGVLEAHLRGIVSSATVMVLERSAARGIRLASERAPRLGLGLHFTVTGGGCPAAAARRVPTLAPGGRFRRSFDELPEVLPADEVRAELEAQIDFFRVLARKEPTHLDSHHHAALHPSIAPVFAAVAREGSFPVRAASDPARQALRGAGVRTPDRFLESFHAEGATVATLEALLDGLPEGVTEVMCHPARVDQELRGSSSYAEERDRELEALTDPGIRRRVRSLGIELVPFGALVPRLR